MSSRLAVSLKQWLQLVPPVTLMWLLSSCGDQTQPLLDPRAKPVAELSDLAEATSISTDTSDYAPGQTVTITGAGFAPDETVELTLTEDAEIHPPRNWTVTADSVGGFVDTSFSPEEHDVGVNFTLDARGLQSERTASTTFSDAIPSAIALYSDASHTLPRQAFERGETIYARGVASSPDLVQKYKFSVSSASPFGALISGYPTACLSPVSGNLDDAHTVAQTDPLTTGSRWTYRLVAFVTVGCTGGVTNRDLTVFVFQAYAYATAAPRNACVSDATCGSPTPRPVVAPASPVYLRIRGFTVSRVGSALRFLKPDGTIACHLGGTLSSGLTADANGAIAVDYPAPGCPAIGAADYGDWQVEATAEFVGSAGASDYPAGSGYKRAFTATLDGFSVKVPTTAEVTASPASPQPFGTSITFTAHVTETSGGADATSGSVEFREGGTDCTNGVVVQAAAAVDGTGRKTYSTAALGVGSTTIRACYAENTHYFGSNGSAGFSTGQAGTSTIVTPSPASPQESGTALTFTAKVTLTVGGGNVTAGNVEFRDGGTDCSTGNIVQAGAALDGNGEKAFLTSGLTVGAHTIRACYLGTTEYSVSAGSAGFTVSQIGTGTVVTPNPASPQEYGTSITFTAKVTRSVGGADVTVGNVEFRDGGTDCSTGSIVQAGAALDGNGERTFLTSTLAVGGHTIRACYLGTTEYATSAGATGYTISQIATSMALTPNPASSQEFGTSITFTAKVTRTAGGANVTVGNVEFRDAGTDCSTGTIVQAGAALNGSGEKTFVTTSLAVGVHTIRACYLGTTEYETESASAAFTITQIGTTTGLTPDVSSPQNFGATVVFTAHVTRTTGGADVTEGAVAFYDGLCGTGTLLQAAGNVDGTGRKALTTSSLASGVHNIRACYGGTTNYASSTGGPLSFTIKAVTTLTYTGGRVLLVPNTLVLSATFTSNAALCSISGKTINFSLTPNPGGGASYATSAVTNANGVASVTVPSTVTGLWAEGTYEIDAVFSADANCMGADDEAALLVATPGNSATGGGFYTLNSYGRLNFGFNVRLVKGTGPGTSVPAQYRGQFLLINTDKWRCKGTLNGYSTTNGVGYATGVCDLQKWNLVTASWDLIQAGASFQTKFTDAGNGAKKTIGVDTFGFGIAGYLGAAPAPPNNYTTPAELKGGDITIQ